MRWLVLLSLILSLNSFTAGAMTQDTEVKYLKDYKKPDFGAKKIFLTIDLQEKDAIVTNEMQVFRNKWAKSTAPLYLNGTNQKLLGIEIDGKKLKEADYKVDKESLTINNVGDDFTIKVTSQIKPQTNTSLEGLYFAEDDIFLTQCEPHGFRNIFYSLDRPDVMSVYTTKLIADKNYNALLSNGDLVESGNMPGGRHYATWHDKSKKPGYLFAAVFGKLDKKSDVFKTLSGKKVALELYTPKKDIDKTDYAMYSLKTAMKWDEDKFGREYDLNTYMIVGTPKFNAGAMENKGLNIFNNALFLANNNIATDMNYMRVIGVIGHEYFHNWTGNRITLRDWFQLSLKEGLTVFRDQEFTADQFSRSIQRIEDANLIKTVQFKEDAGPLSHPVRPDSYISMNNFYTVTVYDKGAEVIRMYKTILGDKNFAKAMDMYFKRHDGEAVTTDDFVTVMEDGGKIDLSQFRLWYSQSGTPVVQMSSVYDEKQQKLTLKAKQSCPATPGQKTKKPFMIPVKVGLIGEGSGNNLKFKYDGKSGDEFVLILTDQEQEFVLLDVKENPIPSLLRDFSAPVRLKYKYKDKDLLKLFAHDANDYNRWNAGQEYVTQYLLRLADDLTVGKKPKVDVELIKAFKSILLDKKLDKAFIAWSISLPKEQTIYDLMDKIDPEKIFNARKYLSKAIGTELKDDLLSTYKSLQEKQYILDHASMAKRSLKNVCMEYLADADEKFGNELALEQLAKADNLTDKYASLKILMNTEDDKLYRQTVEKTYKDWQHEDLLVSKWLMLQALSDRQDTVSIVEQLTSHKAYDIKTPNRTYALFGGFTANLAKFHLKDGSGYKLLTDIIIKLDKLNPHVSARMATKFNDFRRYEPKLSKLMEAQLKRIMKEKKISSNLKEIVSKTLG